jgi:hypothetical protein
MLMNLNKENEVHNPHYKIREQLFFLLDKCIDFGFVNSTQPIIGEYISTGEITQSIKVLGKKSC